MDEKYMKEAMKQAKRHINRTRYRLVVLSSMKIRLLQEHIISGT